MFTISHMGSIMEMRKEIVALIENRNMFPVVKYRNGHFGNNSKMKLSKYQNRSYYLELQKVKAYNQLAILFVKATLD